MRPLVTVHTPTFNRARTLHRVMESLRSQTFRDFEWVIVDDGSSDDTLDKVDAWRGEADFDIIVRPLGVHRGKPFADNEGVKRARGEFFFPLDSDDRVVPEALARFVAAWRSIPDDLRNGFCGITARTRNAELQTPHGPPFPADPYDTTFLDLYYRLGLRHEQCNFFRTDVMREFPFPEVDEFVPESVVWHRIAEKYRTRCINDVLRMWYLGSPHALTGVPGMRHNKGRSYALREFLNRNYPYARRPATSFVWRCMTYARYSRHAKTGFFEGRRALTQAAVRRTYTLTYPAAAALAWRDRLLGRVRD